ncbi:Pre-rRNA-processing protein [Lachnellula hyalina]|uniref:Pre-rRNA-processing protein IPI3 n=1 Tax=Lachnellula hyalina TaxID=1316788 RepID=A0A8H8QWU4_9HELO|nr:Pre-rRNA-processing protein [Lachnellula hyalina]TVY23190.1 Pre-rRNA-processing protein [Lachnellula hyalina]
MLSEGLITSIRAQPKSANTAIAKDVGIYLHELHPTHTIKSSFKKSSTPVNSLVASSTHIFAAQADKAVVHVYSRERGNQEALISFPERIHSLALVGDGILVLGTAEGRIILWEVCTGRQVSTPAAHLQTVSCLAATQLHLVTGSEDSNIHVWSIPRLLSLSSSETQQPLRSLSNHRAAITSLAIGHSSSSTNICVSASKDNTILVWNYHTGDLLRTFLLPSTPFCLALDPCDRAVYAGFEDGSLQGIEFSHPNSIINPLYDTTLQTTPVQITTPPWISPSEPGAALCVGLSYDGTYLFSGHATGKIAQWDTGRRAFSSELTDLNAPVTNLLMSSPFPQKRLTRASTVVKPKLGEGQYVFTAQLSKTTASNSKFSRAVETQGLPADLLEDAIARFAQPASTSTHATSSSGDEKLRQENAELWKVVNEQRALQKKTFEKYTKLKSGGS